MKQYQKIQTVFLRDVETDFKPSTMETMTLEEAISFLEKGNELMAVDNTHVN